MILPVILKPACFGVTGADNSFKWGENISNILDDEDTYGRSLSVYWRISRLKPAKLTGFCDSRVAHW